MEGGCDSDDVQMRRCHRIKEMNMIAKLRQATMPIGVGLAGIAMYALLQVTKPQPAPSIEAPRPVSVEVVPAIRAASRPTVVV